MCQWLCLSNVKYAVCFACLKFTELDGGRKPFGELLEIQRKTIHWPDGRTALRFLPFNDKYPHIDSLQRATWKYRKEVTDMYEQWIGQLITGDESERLPGAESEAERQKAD